MEGGSKLDDAFGQVKQFGFEYAVLAIYSSGAARRRGYFQKAGGHVEQIRREGERRRFEAVLSQSCFRIRAACQGTTGFEIMMRDTHKDLASLELDIFWASVAGHDPVAVLKKYSGRIPLLHLKDKKSGLPVQYNEKVTPDTFREIGNGSIDIPAVLAAAKKSAVRHYFVEQDQTSGSPLDSLRQSYQWLSGHFSS